MRSGSPPTLWCDLIVTLGPPVAETDSMTSGIERALPQEFGAADLFGFFLEHVDEGRADDLALLFGIADAVELAEEKFRRINVNERNVIVAFEERDDLVGLLRPHQPGVDEDAGELVADRLMQQHGDDGGIDAARKAENDPALADLLADLSDRGLAEGGHGPVALAAGDMAREVVQKLPAARRMHDFGMELDAIELPLVVGDGGKRRAVAGADDAEVRAARPRPGRRGSSRPVRGNSPARDSRTARNRRRLSGRRGHIPDDPKWPPCRQAGRTWPAGRSRCRAPARPSRTPPWARAAHLRP